MAPFSKAGTWCPWLAGIPGAAWAPFISDDARKGNVAFPRLRIPLGKPTSHPIS